MSGPRAMSARFRAAALCGIIAVLVGCDGLPSEPPAAAGDEPIRMDRERFVLEAGGRGWGATLGYEFTNRSHRTISLVNCHGQYRLRLDRWDEDEWRLAWAPVVPLCLSSPIEIEPGETHRRELRVFGGYPDTSSHPQFRVEPIHGHYRLVVTAAYWDYDHDGPDWGEEPPLEHRVSEVFELTTTN